MAEFSIYIDCDNAAFEPEPGVELGRILTEVAVRLKRDPYLETSTTGKLRDANGNTVGKWHFVVSD